MSALVVTKAGLLRRPTDADQDAKKDAVAAKDHVADALNASDAEVDRRLKRPDVAGVDVEGFTGGEIAGDNLAGELEPCHAVAHHALQQKSVAAEDACAVE